MCCETLNERCARRVSVPAARHALQALNVRRVRRPAAQSPGWRRGFSLVEIMIVIVIIGLLAGVVTVNVRGYLLKAKQNAARQEIATVMHALDTYYATYGRYPTNEEGLAVLTRPSEKLPESLLSGEPRDPWGHPYQYNSPGANAPYEVLCYGADGREGGEGGDADLTSANLKQ